MKTIEQVFGHGIDHPTRVIAITHSSDLDGWASGVLIEHWVELQRQNIGYEGEFLHIPYSYEKDIIVNRKKETAYNLLNSLNKNDLVIFGDVTPWQHRTLTAALSGGAGRLIVCDHHAEAIKMIEQADDVCEIRNQVGVCRSDKAGCECVWEYLYEEEHEPLTLRFLGDWDRFNRDTILEGGFDMVRRFQEGFKSIHGLHPDDLSTGVTHKGYCWKTDWTEDGAERLAIDPIIRDGSAVVDFVQNRNRNVFRAHKECYVKINNEKQLIGLACVCPDYNNNSFLFEDSLGSHKAYEESYAMYVMPRPGIGKKAGQTTLFSPERDNCPNVGEIATKLGGGGHVHVGGAQCSYTYHECPEGTDFVARIKRFIHKARFDTVWDVLHLKKEKK